MAAVASPPPPPSSRPNLRSSPTFLFLSAVLLLSSFPSSLAADGGCEEARGGCYSAPEALRLKAVAIVAILVASMVGVCLPMFSRSVPALSPDGNLFVVVKAFASGVMLATGYMHVLPDSFEDLTSPCLPENPWRRFPFTTLVAMLSAVFTLMLDSFTMTFHSRGKQGRPSPAAQITQAPTDSALALRRYRIIAQVLEMGIVVHSVVIGLSMGASQNPCTIRPLVVALCFHQMFEGLGLGGCILQAEYGKGMKAVMVFFFSVTTPFGVVLGLALTKVYSDNSPTALIVVGVLNASSAGLLNYTALVDLLAVDFMGPKLQGSARLQAWAYVAVLLGAGGMSLMAKWT